MKKTATWLAALCAALLALHVVGCEHDPEPVAVESVALNTTTLTLAPGEAGKLTATVLPDNADDKTVKWSSSNTDVVMVDSNGTVGAISVGIATITAQAGGKTAVCLVTVKQESVAVESVTLSAETLTLVRGTTRKLTATVLPGNADDRTVAWSSSNADVATVGTDGTVGAIKPGTAIITARADGKEAACTVTVKPVLIAVESVALDMTTLTLASGGGTRKMTATVLPGNADDTAVAWSSSDETVATVSSDGTVTAHAEGTATITAQAGDKEAACEVTVKSILIPVREVYLTKDIMLYPGKTWPLTLVVLPNNADDKTVIWSSSNADIVTVDDDGIITAVKPGTASVTATTREGGKTAACTVTVGVEVERVTFNTETLSLAPGETGKLTVTITPDDATHKAVIWHSSDKSVVTVDDDGTVTAHTEGWEFIEARATGGNSPKWARCWVTVKQILIAVENVTLDAATLTLVPGEERKLTATVTPDNADDKTVAWSSSDTSVATVGSDGTVTAVKAGTATITAQAGGKAAMCTVTVHEVSETPKPVAVESVALDMTTLTLARGTTGKLTATVLPSNADDKTVAWSSSDTAVATVGTDGTVTAVKVGTTTITARAGSKTATCAVTVNPIAVERVTLNTTTLTLTRGKTERLTATVTPSNADDKTVAWSSSDGTVATVSNTGTVTAVKVGTANITAQTGGKTATCAVTVNPILVESVTLYPTTLTLTRGETRKLTATVLPSNADDKTVAWSSSDTSVATVGSDGTVTAVKAGTATITVRAGDKQAICEVIVHIHSYSGGKCTVCGSKPYMKNGTIDDTGVLTKYSGTETMVVIPDGVTSIGNSAFWNCTSLTSVTIPNGVTQIGSDAFYGCTSLTSVTIPNGVTQIGSGAFEKCTSLTSVTIPNGVTKIGSGAFENCTGLTSVTIPNSVTDICAVAFKGCTSLASITIPGSVKIMENSAFLGCKGLTSVTIDDGVTKIADWAFCECAKLTSVTIPKSVTSIGCYAFADCTLLNTVTYEGTKEEWEKIDRKKDLSGDYADCLSGRNIACTDGKITIK